MFHICLQKKHIFIKNAQKNTKIKKINDCQKALISTLSVGCDTMLFGQNYLTTKKNSVKMLFEHYKK
jgi:uncharacterized protein (DUF2267 family)